MVEEVEVEELKSSVTKCVMCKVGKVSPVTRTGRTKADLVIYGRSGMRMAKHRLRRRCVKGSFFPSIAYCFKQKFNQGKVLVTISQTGFDVEYLAIDISSL